MIKPIRTAGIAPGITWVGIEDPERRIFDSLIPLPYGTSYNAYVVAGQSKVALIDTANPGFEQEFMAKVSSVVSPERLDYVVMNHAEPDHGAAIPVVMAAAPKAVLVVSRKGAEMAERYYGIGEDRRLVVQDGDTLDLGGKTLRFVDAPWLHWPETMFTFAVEDRVLFPCDFFGSHIASDKLFEDELGDLVIPEAKRYFAEIMMPFNKMVASGVQKARALNPRIIAPSHGPVHRNPEPIMAAYEKWSTGPLEKKAVLIYVTMWRSTERMIASIEEALAEEGVETVLYDLTTADVSNIARDLVDASAILLGSPTVLGGPHPLAIYALTLVKALRPRVKIAGFFGSYGWGGGAAAQVKGLLEPLGFEIVEPVVEVKGPPTEKEMAAAAQLGHNVGRRIIELDS
jgi:flavorubredoxin